MMKRARMAAAAAAVGAIAVVSLNRPSSALGGTAGRPAATSPPTTAGRSSGGTTTTTPATKSSGALRTAVGKSEQYGFGELAAKVSVRGGRIVDVTVVGLQTAEPTSQSIADQAIPELRSEVLSAQSAHINAISGATYTSEGYAGSVQSALDQLHLS